MSKKYKTVVTGGNGRFGKELRKNSNQNYLFPSKKKLNILNLTSIENYLKKHKPKYLIHLAGFSRPMIEHEYNISKSIQLNIIGTSNIVIACKKFNIKLIYFSTSYIYPGKKGNYKETDPLLPWNNYGWSKLGAESAVQMYKNSLIVRACMTEKPFMHKYAFSDVKTNFIFHDQFAKIFIKLINRKGIINIGGKPQSIYSFAKNFNKKIKKKKSNGEIPLNIYMNLNKLKKYSKK